MYKYLILFLTVSITIGCKKESVDKSCNIVESPEAIYEILDECNENLILSAADIEENLIGDWYLSGIIPGWTIYEPTAECLMLSIDSDSLTLKNLNTGEETSSTWTITSYEVNNYEVFFLQPEKEELRWLVGMQNFSENIMYGAGFAFDTDSYVYER